MQAPPRYHTSGEVVEVVSTPGLERIARFLLEVGCDGLLVAIPYQTDADYEADIREICTA